MAFGMIIVMGPALSGAGICDVKDLCGSDVMASAQCTETRDATGGRPETTLL